MFLNRLMPLLLMLLVFGCTQPTETVEEPVEPIEEPKVPMEAPNGEVPAEAEPLVPPQEEQPTEEPTEELDVSMQTCFALMGTGIPVECTMTTHYEGQSTSVKFYMHGQDKIRYEMSSGMEDMDCQKMVMVHRDDTLYMGCEGGKYMGTTCDWYMAIPGPQETGEPGETTPVQDYTAQLEHMPTTQCSCSPWLPDESKFQTSGKVCDEEEFMQELMQGMDFNFE